MSCTYCDIKEYGKRFWVDAKELFLADGWYTDLRIIYYNESKEFRLAAVGEDKAEIKINYCPICGRKLY